MERVTRRHAPHREELQLAGFAAQLRRCLEPIDLTLLTPVVTLRHEHFPATEPELLLPSLYVPPHRRLGDWISGMFFAQPCPDPMRRVPLLPRRLPVTLQHLVDVFF